MTCRFLVPLATLLTLTACNSLGFRDHVGDEKLYWQSPVLLPEVTPDLRRAGFWVSQLKDPDTVVMDQDQIQAFNKDLEDRHLVLRLPLAAPEPMKVPLDQQLREGLEFLKKTEFHFPTGEVPGADWWTRVEANFNLDKGKTEVPVYALTTAFADQRVLPDATRLTLDPYDVDFDEFQNSAYDIGTPFAVYRESTDGKWVWARGPLSEGWSEKKNLAVCTQKDLEDWQSRDFVVVTSAKADLYGDKDRRTWKGWVRMGCRLPLEADEGDLWRVTLPVTQPDGTLGFRSAWVEKTAGSHGYLPYTARTIVTQAFQLLDKPYGWGDMYGEQDCSRFVAQVFATVGVLLPRNSKDQGAAGVARGTFTRQDPRAAKLAAVEAGSPALTLLRLNGHIMLYLGIWGGKPYVIHSFWGYPQKDGWEEVFRVVNRTSVSTLDLGDGSRKGSLLDRILDVREIRLPPSAPAP